MPDPNCPKLLVNADWKNCLYCGVALKRNHPTDGLTREHIFPRSEGGVITIPACKTCNSARGKAKIKDWLCSEVLKARQSSVNAQVGWMEPPPIKVMLWLHGEAKRKAVKPIEDRA